MQRFEKAEQSTLSLARKSWGRDVISVRIGSPETGIWPIFRSRIAFVRYCEYVEGVLCKGDVAVRRVWIFFSLQIGFHLEDRGEVNLSDSSRAGCSIYRERDIAYMCFQ